MSKAVHLILADRIHLAAMSRVTDYLSFVTCFYLPALHLQKSQIQRFTDGCKECLLAYGSLLDKSQKTQSATAPVFWFKHLLCHSTNKGYGNGFWHRSDNSFH